MNRRTGQILVAIVVVIVCLLAVLLDRANDRRPDRPDGDRASSAEDGAVPGVAPEEADGVTEGTEDESGTGKAAATPPASKDAEKPFSLEDETDWSVTVRVVDPEGKPVKARVFVHYAYSDWRLGELPARDGAFFGHLPEPENYYVVSDWRGTRIRAPVAITDEQPAAEIEIRYPGSGSVSGTVVGARGAVEKDVKGKGWVAGRSELSVELIPDRGAGKEAVPLLSARVDEAGAYRIEAVPAGVYLVRVKNKFHASRVTVGENEHVVHDIKLGGGRIFGRVTEEGTGKPLSSGVQVVLSLMIPDQAVGEISLRAGMTSVSDRFSPDENGNYEFTNLPTGEYRLFSNGMKHAPVRSAATITEQTPDARVDFVLPLGSSVDITITDLEGKPVGTPLWMTQGIRCGFVGHVRGLTAGTADFIAYGVGFEVQVRKDVVFLPGEPTKLEFKLAPEVPTALVFVDPGGLPVLGVRVSVPTEAGDLQKLMAFFLRERNLPFGTTGADGRVMLRGVKAGPVRIVAKRTGFELIDRNVTLAPGEETITIRLTPAETEFRFRVRITRVGPGTEAARLGLREGDVIVSYGGKKILALGQLVTAIQAATAAGAETVKVVVERDGKSLEFTAKTGALGVGFEEIEE